MDPGNGKEGQQGDEVCVAGATISEILRLLSGGATGAILMALGEGPLRTKELTERVPGYTPRTIYRYSGKLAELEIVEREVEEGPPTKVVHTLTDPCGTELHELVERYADAALERLPDGSIDALDWATLGLLADMWESGMVDALSCGPLSPTELARGPHGLSYHQVNRRAGLFETAGLLYEVPGPGRARLLALTEKTRRAMALITGIGRWRHHHVIAEDEEGMTATEMATVLRIALPLVEAGACDGSRNLRMDIRHSEGDLNEDVTVWLELQRELVHVCAAPLESIDEWASGEVKDWIPALLDGDPEQLEVGGREAAARVCVQQLHESLWRPPVPPPELVSP